MTSVTLSEAGAEALLAGVAVQSAQDLTATRGVTVGDRLEAWEFLRTLRLNRQQLHRLLEQAEQALQEAQRNGRNKRI